MKVSKEIAEKVKRYQELKSEVDNLYEELQEFFEYKHGIEGFVGAFIADEPKGTRQSADGEFCYQIPFGEDSYSGEYYYPIKNSDKYVGCDYYI